MTLEQRKNCIADKLSIMADEVRGLESQPQRTKVMWIIGQLFQIMRLLADLSDENGY